MAVFSAREDFPKRTLPWFDFIEEPLIPSFFRPLSAPHSNFSWEYLYWLPIYWQPTIVSIHYNSSAIIARNMYSTRLIRTIRLNRPEEPLGCYTCCTDSTVDAWVSRRWSLIDESDLCFAVIHVDLDDWELFGFCFVG